VNIIYLTAKNWDKRGENQLILKKSGEDGLSEITKIQQPVIARLETGSSNAQIMTVIKILHALGKTLAVVPLKGVSKTKETCKKLSNQSSSKGLNNEAMVAKGC